MSQKTIVLGDGNDAFAGTTNSDHIKGMGGNDDITGGEGDDFIEGGEGNDVIRGGLHDDVLDGGPGNDIVFGGGGEDLIIWSEGNDIVDGRDNIDTLMLKVNFADATIVLDATGRTLITTESGFVSVRNVEILQFADRVVTLEELFGGSSSAKP